MSSYTKHVVKDDYGSDLVWLVEIQDPHNRGDGLPIVLVFSSYFADGLAVVSKKYKTSTKALRQEPNNLTQLWGLNGHVLPLFIAEDAPGIGVVEAIRFCKTCGFNWETAYQQFLMP